MSTIAQEKIHQSLRKDIDLIEKEIIVISEMAAEVSVKFQGLSSNIQNISGIVGLFAGRKAGGATNLIGGAVGLFGDIYAGMKQDEALAKLAPKKLELARAKSEVISNFHIMLNNQSEKLWELFTIEANRSYEVEKLDEFIDLYGEGCKNSFYMYVKNYYLIEVCDYMLDQFKSWGWSNGKNDNSTAVKPDKTYILEYILTNVILPDTTFIDAISNNTSTGGIWLMSQDETLFAVLLQKMINESTNNDENTKKRVVNKNSFITLKKHIKELKAIENKDNLIWLKENNIYLQAKTICKLTSLNMYLFKYFYIGMFCVLLYNGWSNPNNALIDFIIYLPLLTIFPALILIPCARFVFWSYEDEGLKTVYYYILFLIFTILTLGLMPIAFNRYKKKEENYITFVNQLKVNN